MNKLDGHIAQVKSNGNISIVQITISEDIQLKCIVLENVETAPYLKPQKPVRALFKETEVIIGTDLSPQVSLQNIIPGKIMEVRSDVLLSNLTIQTKVGTLTSIISSNAVKQLALKAQMNVVAMIKLNEIMLSEI